MRCRISGGVFLGVSLVLVGACVKDVPPSDTAPAPAPVEVAPAVAPTPPPSGPGLVVAANPPEAELIIDGEGYGPVSGLKTTNGLLPLKPGIYQVALKLAGYVSWRAEVTVNESPERLQVTLKPQ